ncbi:MAG: hypothetical protein H6513_01715 [Acidimicrobiaceae bacterium]|nr:hypothetical protein [Ilumatobacter sp.]MCB9379389.1 hypothetical protein [Acidimicrobiaceae bacterium]MCO5330075.1 hypothetical protein [Ilumatobacteraceae bacterium]
MAAPKSAPAPVLDDARAYSSPPVAPAAWMPNRKAELTGFQPSGPQLGYQGPDQGFALKIAAGFRDRLQLAPGEDADDAIRGCLGIALRRASLFSRAPVVHDLTIAFTIWGYLDANAPEDLVDDRWPRFRGVANAHHYTEARALADMVPEATLRMTPEAVKTAYPGRWRELTGVAA